MRTFQRIVSVAISGALAAVFMLALLVASGSTHDDEAPIFIAHNKDNKSDKSDKQDKPEKPERNDGGKGDGPKGDKTVDRPGGPVYA
ncbi:MAG: hypothetical protein LC803_23610 [Acidobacteria bacterium]|nr:hypothetical protein [Acidobacteriota bacterium]